MLYIIYVVYYTCIIYVCIIFSIICEISLIYVFKAFKVNQFNLKIDKRKFKSFITVQSVRLS